MLGQFREHRFSRGRLAGGGLADDRHAELFVENHPELLGRAEIEFLTGDGERFALKLGHLVAQLDALIAEQVGIDQRALTLDARQYRHERHFDVVQYRGQTRRLGESVLQHFVQAQRQVDLFSRIRTSLFQRDLVETQLFCTFARDVLEIDRRVVQILGDQAVTVVTRRGGVEHIGFEHRVELDALHVDAMVLVTIDGAVGQQVDRKLGVLPDLDFARVLQHRLDRFEHRVAIQLLLHAHIGMGKRDVTGFVGLDRERQADDLRALGVSAVALHHEGEQLRGFKLLQPVVELGLLKDELVLGLDDRRRLGSGNDFSAFLPGVALQIGDPALEFQLGVQRHQRFTIRLAAVQSVELDVQRHVDLDGRQLVGQEGHLLVFFELGRQGFGAPKRQRCHFVEVRVKLFQAAVDAHQQACCGFLTDTGHAGDVVDLVAHQRQVIDDVFRADAELFFHAGDIQHAAGHGVDQGDVAVDQLRHVFVTGGDDHRTIRGRAAARQCADHVIGLNAFNAQQWVAEASHAVVQEVDLHPHVVRHAGAVGFVLAVQRVAERSALGIENHGKRAFGVLPAQAFEHVQHALDRTGGQAFGGHERRQRMERAV